MVAEDYPQSHKVFKTHKIDFCCKETAVFKKDESGQYVTISTLK